MIKWRNVNALYQIYPRSFYDSNGDGVGDLCGIIEKLDYIKGTTNSLGVDSIWVSPFFTSPMHDFGYDVSDMQGVDPIFGVLDDFKELVEQAHLRDIKIIIDYVPNHTSSEHPWFQNAKQSKPSDKRDYYVWKDPAPDGGPPNNWTSLFDGSAWEYDSTSRQYYLHSFLKEQPDLNWDNPLVRTEMQNVMRFWLDLGVDGFRADAVWCLSKDPEFRDNPSDGLGGYIHRYSKDGPNLFRYLNELTEVLAEYSDKKLIFEYYPDPVRGDVNSQFLPFFSDVNSQLSAPFNFEGMRLAWNASAFGAFIASYQDIITRYNGLPIYCFGNHDQPRIVTRFGLNQARIIALLQLTLPGLPAIYNGDEIGMQNGNILPHQVRDPSASKAMGGRDPQRTPMQWNSTINAGFTAGKPWLPVAESYTDYNVENELINDNSFLHLYKALLQLRHNDPTLMMSGGLELVSTDNNILVYKRQGNARTYLAVLNFANELCNVVVPKGDILLAANYDDVISYSSNGELVLKPYGAVVINL